MFRLKMRFYSLVCRRISLFLILGIALMIKFRFFCNMQSSKIQLPIFSESARFVANSSFKINLSYDFITFNINDPPPMIFSGKISELRKYDFVIGVPSFARPSGAQYLERTLQSLIENYKRDLKNSLSVHIVVLLNNYTSEAIDQLIHNFSSSINQQILEFIIPPSDFYHLLDVDERPPTYKDKAERTFWRKRQNLDYAYLIAYCRPLTAKYYLQMEDDAIAAKSFISKTIQFIESLQDPDWFMLGLAKFGLYGKLFKAQDMTALAAHIYNFYWVKPVDLTVYEIIHLLCNESKNKCLTNADKKFVYDLHQLQNTSLFQHIGDSSSFNADINKLSESNFHDR